MLPFILTIYTSEDDLLVAGLAKNGVRLNAHAPTHAIFSFGMWLLHALFSISDLLGVRLSYVWHLLRASLHVQSFLLFFMFFQSWSTRGMKGVEEDIC